MSWSMFLLWQQLTNQMSATLAQRVTKQPLPNKPGEQGFSILECLMAIIIIGLTALMVTPPLFVATATRAQNRRAEQAFQIAQGQVDQIRVLVEKGQHFPASLPGVVTATGGLANVSAPTSISSYMQTDQSSCAGTTKYTGQQLPINAVLQIDIDNDCKRDYLMQIFRTQGAISGGESATGGAGRPANFQVGIRVYAALAASTGSLSGLQNPVKPASLTLTSGQGSQRSRPLAVLYTTYTWSDQGFALCWYQKSGNSTRECNGSN